MSSAGIINKRGKVQTLVDKGQVNRLKMIKRQMYGRANFDLLRARVLHAV
ncbi:MAG: hypothetical protein LC802_10005 [Acidobacteria bacterium]|nr:hypothetical protein [Acidobacteriota bacterium]